MENLFAKMRLRNLVEEAHERIYGSEAEGITEDLRKELESFQNSAMDDAEPSRSEESTADDRGNL